LRKDADLDHLPVHGGQRLRRQHQPVRCQRGTPVEPQQGLAVAEDLAAEGQDLAAEDVVLHGERPQPPGQLGSPGGVGADHLDGDQ
jgi:hypothetical protein